MFLTGPSGAGKTTLMRLLFAAERPSEGQILVLGRNVARIGERGDSARCAAASASCSRTSSCSRAARSRRTSRVALEVVGTPRREVRGKVFAMLKRVGLQHRRHHRPLVALGRRAAARGDRARARERARDPARRRADRQSRPRAHARDHGPDRAAARARHDGARRHPRRTRWSSATARACCASRADASSRISRAARCRVTALVAQLYYFVRSALARPRASSQLTTVVSIATIAVTLVPLGGLRAAGPNMERAARPLRRRAARHRLPRRDGASDAGRSLAARASAIPGVERGRVREPGAGARALPRAARRAAALLEGLEENPLPASLEIALAPRAPLAGGARRACPTRSHGAARRRGGRAAATTWVEGYARAVRAGAQRRHRARRGPRARDAADRRQHDPARGLRAPRRARDPLAGRREPHLRARAVPDRGPAAGRGRRRCSALGLLFAVFHVAAAAAPRRARARARLRRIRRSSRRATSGSLVAGGAALGFIGAAAAVAATRVS